MRRHLRVLLLLGLLLPSTVYSSGAIQTNLNGLPLHWSTSTPLTYNPEGGALKSTGSYNRANSLALVRDAFNAWISSHPSIALNAVEDTGPLNGIDIDAGNFDSFFNVGTEACYDENPGTQCLSPIIFDEDGEIIDELFGSCAKFSILGFAGFDDIDDGSGDPSLAVVKRGQAVFSGACLPDTAGNPVTKPGCQPCKRILTDVEIRTIVTHEIGHLMGMDHNQVNPDIAKQCSVPTGCPPEVAEGIPTMFPILVNQAASDTLHPDDEAYFIKLYGNTGDHCSVSGRVLASDGSTEVRGVEVAAHNTDPSQNFLDAIAFVSGAEAPRFSTNGDDQGNCKQNCGDYLITHLSDGETYQLCAQRISASFTGGSSIEPVDPPFRAFTDACPSGLTVTCDCTGGCANFSGKDLITDADPNDIDQGPDSPNLQDPIGTGASGGCSLAKPRAASWGFLKNLLVSHIKIQ